MFTAFRVHTQHTGEGDTKVDLVLELARASLNRLHDLRCRMCSDHDLDLNVLF
jgi:hypothetical protein